MLSGVAAQRGLEGQNGQSQEVVQEGKYSRKEGNFEQKSVIGASLTIAN